jgi:hypothetical protein
MGRRVILLLASTLLLAGCGNPPASDGSETHSHSDGMTHQAGMTHGTGSLATQPGQAAFGALQEVVALLDSDPTTDWATVNISALRDHLLDMDALVLRSRVTQTATQDGFRATVTGDAQVVAAANRMVDEHVTSLHRPSWRFEVGSSNGSVELVAHGADPSDAQVLQGLGFFGVMATDSHHAAHHLMLAKGQAMHGT